MTDQINPWYRSCFRRILVDMHIPDWDKRFFSKLDPKAYARTVLRGNPSSTMLYVNSHVGLALYPSKVGPVHANLRSKDFVRGAVEEFHRNKAAVVAYYSVVFDNVAFMEHPDWRIKPIDGMKVYRSNRYGVCCPNSPYRNFSFARLKSSAADMSLTACSSTCSSGRTFATAATAAAVPQGARRQPPDRYRLERPQVDGLPAGTASDGWSISPAR